MRLEAGDARRDDRRPGRPPGPGGPGPRRRARPAPGRASTPRGRRPGRAAAGRAPRARRGTRRPARSRTARRPGRGGSRASASARDASAATRPARPVASTTVCRKRTFLATESTSSARSAPSAAASGMPGIAAARAEVEQPGDAALAAGAAPQRGESSDVEARDLVRVADRGQVDRRGPGEQQPGVGVDRGAGRRVEVQAQLAQAGIEDVGVRVRESGRGPEHASGADLSGRTGHPPRLVVRHAAREPLPASL